MSFTNNGLSADIKALARDILEGKAKNEEFVIPEDIAKEDVGDFVVAASAAKKAGKKEFEFGGKKFPVTIKTDIKTDEEVEKEDDKEDDKKKVKNDVEVNPKMDEEAQLDETGVAGGQYSPIKKFDSPKHEDDVELIDNLPEASAKEIKMAIGIASDKRYAGGNMTGAVQAIEKIKKGLSKHKQVAAVLKRQNEELDEGAMKKFHQMMDDGATADEIAKALKIDLKTVKKLMKEDKDFHPEHFLAIKEAFEEFMTEGTMAHGIFSRDKATAAAAMDALKDLMRKKLPVGRDGSSSAVEDKIYDIVFDDELFDNFEELRDEKGDNADARPIIKARLKQLRVRV